MRENTSKLVEEIASSGHPLLAGRVSRLVQQERASAAIDAYLEEKSPRLEALSDHLEFEMADMLQQHFDEGDLDPEGPVKANREILKLIARHAAMKFRALQPAPMSVAEAARVLLEAMPNYAMERAAVESRATDDEGEFASLGDLLDFSGQNKTHTVVREALNAAFRALASPEGE